MKSVIIAIGDELLIGQVINTNASFIAEKLNSIGIEVIRMLTVADSEIEIIDALKENYQPFDVIIITGGLGPTHDDVTKKAICSFFKTDLISSPEARENVRQYLQQRNQPWSAAAEEQTLVPRGATIIPNKLGTASGELFERDSKYFIIMPGVPCEMESMVIEFVVPLLEKRSTEKVILHRTLKTTGIPEAMLVSQLGNVDEFLKEAKLAFLPSASGVRMRITVVDSERASGESKIREIESHIRAKVGKYCYGIDDEELEDVVGKLLGERNLKIAVAESCTGGMIAHKITNVPGSSVYFDRAIIAYSNKAKIGQLNVSQELLKKHGAVSEEVADAMASGVRSVARTDIGISTTGIAGPSGGTSDKPVGLVWIGYSDVSKTFALKFNFGTQRLQIKERATQAALELVRRTLLSIA